MKLELDKIYIDLDNNPSKCELIYNNLIIELLKIYKINNNNINELKDKLMTVENSKTQEQYVKNYQQFIKDCPEWKSLSDASYEIIKKYIINLCQLHIKFDFHKYIYENIDERKWFNEIGNMIVYGFLRWIKVEYEPKKKIIH